MVSKFIGKLLDVTRFVTNKKVSHTLIFTINAEVLLRLRKINLQVNLLMKTRGLNTVFETIFNLLLINCFVQTGNSLSTFKIKECF